MNDFVDWLNEELNKRGWGQNELARRAGVSSGSISHIVNRRKNPGFDVCVGVAEALRMPPEAVLRRAGLLPPLPGIEGDVRLSDIVDCVRRLNPGNREDVLAYARWRYEQEQGS